MVFLFYYFLSKEIRYEKINSIISGTFYDVFVFGSRYG